MGEARTEALRVGFNRALRMEFHGAKMTGDAGLPAYRELDETLDLAEVAIPRGLFRMILQRIGRLALPPPEAVS